MKNNFDLKKFLIENKLTANSRQIAERNDIVSTQDLDAAAAFKDAGIDMSQPVLVLTQDGGHGGQETKGTVSAENALNMFSNLRAQALESGKEDHYEFDNEIGFSAEGYEYKVAYFEEESTTTALMQKASGELNERTDIVPTKELKASAAFRDAGIDMNEPILVLTQDGGHGEQETKGTVSAEEALKMFQQLRADGIKSGKEDHYEFDNEVNFSAEGYEYKIAYFEEESTTTALMQKASGKLKEESSENTNLPELRKQVESKLSGKHDEHLVDSVLHDCFESAERLMDEEPGTSAADALYSVAENWEENYYDEGRDEEEAIAKDIVSVVKPLSGGSTSGIFSESVLGI
jgi:molybdenum-dependent DNA-binding transcriptional regulator ModE